MDYFWEEAHFARFLRRLASFSRLILFDKGGTGLSDRAVGVPGLEEQMDDLRAVMDAAGSRRATLLGVSEAGAMCTLFAATYLERTSALVLIGCVPRRLWAPDSPWGRPRPIVRTGSRRSSGSGAARKRPPATWSGGRRASRRCSPVSVSHWLGRGTPCAGSGAPSGPATSSHGVMPCSSSPSPARAAPSPTPRACSAAAPCASTAGSNRRRITVAGRAPHLPGQRTGVGAPGRLFIRRPSRRASLMRGRSARRGQMRREARH